MRNWISLDRAANVAVIAAAATFIALSVRGYYGLAGQGRSTDVTAVSSGSAIEPVKDMVVSIESATTKSTGSPRIALIEFSDFQCPFCAAYARDTYRRIQQDFVDTGAIEYAFFNFPLEQMHPLALHAGEAAECAGQQGRFWEMHDALFQQQNKGFSDQHFFDLADTMKLDRTKFRACLDGTTLGRIRLQAAEGGRIGVSSTPVFLVGKLTSSGTVTVSHRIRGTNPYSVFAEVLKEALGSRSETN